MTQAHVLAVIALCALMSWASTLPAMAHHRVFGTVEELAPPVGASAHEPRLMVAGAQDIMLSWTQPEGRGDAVYLARLQGNLWDAPRLVHGADDMFVNWADYPAIAAFEDGTLAAHWLRRSNNGLYEYDIEIGLSRDGGASWAAPVTPHDDGRITQHGFVSMVALDGNRLAVIWLDGRAYDQPAVAAAQGTLENAMQLRANILGADGRFEGDTLVDVQTCSCCQTSAVAAGDGSVLLAYRDRTNAEIRDIAVVRLAEGVWSDPVPVRADGWEISGCPVNGPAIDANGNNAVVAWFTAAGDVPAVQLAFSGDAGRSFGAAQRVDLGDPSGRVDVILLDDGSALVSWLEWTQRGESLMVCRATATDGCVATEALVMDQTYDTMNFPVMVQAEAAIFLAWTEPLAGGDTGVRMLRATLAE